jgi:ribosomal protein L7Ae-like RNA K-turn-binding protein
MTASRKKWRQEMDNKALNYLALARKGGRAELGEEPVGAAARALKAHLILVAGDASDHTWRRAKSYAAGTDQQCIRMECTKDEMGFAIGRTSLAIAAVTDVQLALALVNSLGQPEKYKQCLEVLDTKAQRLKKRQAEAKAHQRNKRFGKKK